MLAPYARTETTAILAVGIVLTAATALLLGWWALLPAVLAGAALSFYRDPPRRIPAGENLLLSPADGRIVQILRDVPSDDGLRRELQIVIFLSVLNAHVNRSPCAGQVRDVRYRQGDFLNALAAESTERNERNTLTLQPAPPIPGPILVRQIAGALARRIVCVARTGQTLRPGERFGMIKLGSRTEIRVPETRRWSVLVGVGDCVKAGRTILARLNEGSQDPDRRAGVTTVE